MFGILNIITIVVICWLARVDQRDLLAKIIPAGSRVIDTRVIMSLLGATTVQLGTIAVIMARFVFRDHD